MKATLCLFTVLTCISLAWTLPSAVKEDALPSSFVSHASQLIATQMLKHYKDIDGNQVHSPVGIAGILAVLAEAAEGETFDEFNKVFGFPKERSELRAAFQQVLGNYQNRDASVPLPSFQTWFYVYRNNSVRENFKELLEQHYYVEVKDINRQQTEWMDINPSLQLDENNVGTEQTNGKDVIGFETLKRINLDDDVATASSDNFGEEVIDKEASKFDRDVDDKQYVEKPVALAEAERLQQLQLQEQSTTEESATATESPTSNDAPAEKLENPAEIVPSAEPENAAAKQLRKRSDEKSALPVQMMKNVAKSMMTKDEKAARIGAAPGALSNRGLFGRDDIAAALSANSITGRALDSKFKMLLFNGLYFRGDWAQPFYQLRDGRDEFFFMANDSAMKATMMHTRGKFRVAELPHLKARVLSLPYENPKYGICIVLPNESEGLNDVISQLQPSDFKYARQHAQFKQLHVTLPKFQVEETAYSEAMLKELGLKRLFSRTEAQLGPLSEDEDVHVDEIVQFVNVRVDEGGSSANALSAATAQARSPITVEGDATVPVSEPEPEPGVERFDVDRPFAYFVMDCEEQFVLASGKVFAPEFKDVLPSVSVEVELDQS